MNGGREIGLGRNRAAVWVLAIGVLDFSLEQTIIIPALPALQAEYATSPTAVAWVITGFLLALAVATPLAGRLGDSFGRRRVLLASLGLFAAGSLISALSGSIAMLIAGRIIQGLGAGVGPLAVALARDQVGREAAPRAVGLIVGLAGIGGVLGFLASGWLVEAFSVSAIFWALFIVAAALIAAVALLVPESTARRRDPIDLPGAALLAGALVPLMLAISQGNEWGWGSTAILALLAGSALLAAGFAFRELRAATPLVDLEGLRQPAILTVNLATLAVGFALFVAYALVPLIAGLPEETGYGLGLSTIEIGLLLLPGAIANLIGGPLGGRTVGRVGARTQALAGVLMAGLAYAGLVIFTNTTAVLAMAMVPLGFGIAVTMCAFISVLVLSADQEATGVTLGINGVIRAVGAALGAQVAVAVLTAAPEASPGVPAASGFTDAFAMTMVAAAVALAVVALIPRRGSDPVIAATAAGTRASPRVVG